MGTEHEVVIIAEATALPGRRDELKRAKGATGRRVCCDRLGGQAKKASSLEPYGRCGAVR